MKLKTHRTSIVFMFIYSCIVITNDILNTIIIIINRFFLQDYIDNMLQP